MDGNCPPIGLPPPATTPDDGHREGTTDQGQGREPSARRPLLAAMGAEALTAAGAHVVPLRRAEDGRLRPARKGWPTRAAGAEEAIESIAATDAIGVVPRASGLVVLDADRGQAGPPTDAEIVDLVARIGPAPWYRSAGPHDGAHVLASAEGRPGGGARWEGAGLVGDIADRLAYLRLGHDPAIADRWLSALDSPVVIDWPGLTISRRQAGQGSGRLGDLTAAEWSNVQRHRQYKWRRATHAKTLARDTRILDAVNAGMSQRRAAEHAGATRTMVRHLPIRLAAGCLCNACATLRIHQHRLRRTA